MNVDFVLNYRGFILLSPSSIYIGMTWKWYYLQCAPVCTGPFYVWKVFFLFFFKGGEFPWHWWKFKVYDGGRSCTWISLSRTEVEEETTDSENKASRNKQQSSDQSEAAEVKKKTQTGHWLSLFMLSFVKNDMNQTLEQSSDIICRHGEQFKAWFSSSTFFFRFGLRKCRALRVPPLWILISYRPKRNIYSHYSFCIDSLHPATSTLYIQQSSNGRLNSWHDAGAFCQNSMVDFRSFT